MMKPKIIEWFLRISLSVGFLSASADRFGLWGADKSAWGNWPNFVNYTKQLLPFFPDGLVNVLAIIATSLEILFGILLLINFKTHLVAIMSGVLLLVFGITMAISLNMKAPLDYSVFTAAAAAFALSVITEKNKQ